MTSNSNSANTNFTKSNNEHLSSDLLTRSNSISIITSTDSSSLPSSSSICNSEKHKSSTTRNNNQQLNLVNTTNTIMEEERRKSVSTAKLSPDEGDMNGRLFSFYQLAMRENEEDHNVKTLEELNLEVETKNGNIVSLFNLPLESEIINEFSCWLIRSVLLKGRLYVTSTHLCFHAILPTETESIVKSGYLKKHNSTCWVVLKDDVLTFYEDINSAHFILGAVKMSDVTAIERSSKKSNDFVLIKENKKIKLHADTEAAMDDWVRKLRAAMFRSQSEDNQVKIAVPLGCVSETELSSSISKLDIIKISAKDDESDEQYYLTYFTDASEAFEAIQKQIEAHQTIKSQFLSPPALYQQKEYSIYSNSPSPSLSPTSHPSSIAQLSSHSPEKISPFLDVASEDNFVTKKHWAASNAVANSLPGSAVTTLRSPPVKLTKRQIDSALRAKSHEEESRPSKEDLSPTKHKIKSVKSPDATENHHNMFSVKNWKRWMSFSSSQEDQSENTLHSSASPTEKKNDHKAVSAVASTTTTVPASMAISSYFNSNSNAFPKLKWSNSTGTKNSVYAGWRQREKRISSIRADFALSQTEVLIQEFPAYLYKSIPRFGTLYIFENCVCFKSSLVGIKTMALVPFLEISKVISEDSYSPIPFRIIIVSEMDEKIYLDFASESDRNYCHGIIKNQLSAIKATHPKKLISMSRSPSEASAVDNNNIVQPSFDAKQIVKIPHPLAADGTHYIRPKPMHITCLTIGTRGDVQPYIALCKGLMKHGHTCRIATHLEYKEWIEGHQIEFREVKGNPADLMQLCVEHGMFTYSFLKEAHSKFKGWIDELLYSSWEACQGTELLIESPTAMAGVHIADKLNIPFFSAFPMPWTRTKVYPHPFAVSDRPLGSGYNYVSYVLMEQILWVGISDQVNRFRKETLQKSPIGYNTLMDIKIPFLYSFSPSVVPPPVDWPDWIHESGYWFLDNPELKWNPPESLVKFIENGPKPVYIGFGSIVVNDPDEMTRTIIEAVRKAGVRAILSKGWSARMKEGQEKSKSNDNSNEVEYPDFIYPLDKVPHDWLFPQTAAVVHHGGAGTTSAAIRAGVPCIIKPFFGDQYFWASRVQDLGIGFYLRKLSKEKLASQLTQITTDESMAQRAKTVGQKVRQEKGVDDAIDFIYRYMGHAKAQMDKLALASESSKASTAATSIGTANNNHSTGASSYFNTSSFASSATSFFKTDYNKILKFPILSRKSSQQQQDQESEQLDQKETNLEVSEKESVKNEHALDTKDSSDTLIENQV